jgi:hypothetical protein
MISAIPRLSVTVWWPISIRCTVDGRSSAGQSGNCGSGCVRFTKCANHGKEKNNMNWRVLVWSISFLLETFGGFRCRSRCKFQAEEQKQEEAQGKRENQLRQDGFYPDHRVDGDSIRRPGCSYVSDTGWALTRVLSIGVKLLPHLLHLLSRLVEGAGVVNNVVGGFDFFLVRKLCGHAADDFFTCGFKRDFLARGETGGSLVRVTSHDNEPIEAIFDSRLENQRRLHHGNPLRILQADRIRPFILAPDDNRVDDAVQICNAGRTFALGSIGRTECRLGELGAVYRSIMIENSSSEVANNLVVDRLARLHQGMRNPVRLDQVCPEPNEHLSHCRFAGGDTPSKANF